jgi:hypothetical protein
VECSPSFSPYLTLLQHLTTCYLTVALHCITSHLLHLFQHSALEVVLVYLPNSNTKIYSIGLPSLPGPQFSRFASHPSLLLTKSFQYRYVKKTRSRLALNPEAVRESAQAARPYPEVGRRACSGGGRTQHLPSPSTSPSSLVHQPSVRIAFFFSEDWEMNEVEAGRLDSRAGRVP